MAEGRLIGNFPLLPLRTKTRGPAYVLPAPEPPIALDEAPDPDSESYDILDEVLALFRANTFFRNFEIQGPADRLLVYGIWFISDCLTKIKPTASAREATKDVTNLALDTKLCHPGRPGLSAEPGEFETIAPKHQTSELTCQMYEPPATDRNPKSSASTWPRCARSSPSDCSRGYTRRAATASRASGGSASASGSSWASRCEEVHQIDRNEFDIVR